MSDVTIIVATYDRPAWCEVALHSALAAADGFDARILVLDNASPTDYARRLATRYGTDYLRMARNGPEFMAAAFSRVDSTYAAVLYDDDVMLPRWLPAHLEIMEQGFDVVAGSFHLTDAELRVTGTRILRPATLEDLRAGIVSCNDGSLIRTAVLDGVRWRTDRQPFIWLATWLQLAAKGARFGAVTEPTWLYRQHGGQMIRNLSEHDREQRALVLAEAAA